MLYKVCWKDISTKETTKESKKRCLGLPTCKIGRKKRENEIQHSGHPITDIVVHTRRVPQQILRNLQGPKTLLDR